MTLFSSHTESKHYGTLHTTLESNLQPSSSILRFRVWKGHARRRNHSPDRDLYGSQESPALDDQAVAFMVIPFQHIKSLDVLHSECFARPEYKRSQSDYMAVSLQDVQSRNIARRYGTSKPDPAKKANLLAIVDNCEDTARASLPAIKRLFPSLDASQTYMYFNLGWLCSVEHFHMHLIVGAPTKLKEEQWIYRGVAACRITLDKARAEIAADRLLQPLSLEKDAYSRSAYERCWDDVHVEHRTQSPRFVKHEHVVQRRYHPALEQPLQHIRRRRSSRLYYTEAEGVHLVSKQNTNL